MFTGILIEERPLGSLVQQLPSIKCTASRLFLKVVKVLISKDRYLTEIQSLTLKLGVVTLTSQDYQL